MKDANYYLAEMQKYKEKLDLYVQQVDDYTKFIEKLMNLRKYALISEEGLRIAKNSFYDGGYIVEGKIFDHDNLKSNCKNIKEAVEDLESIILRSQDTLEAFAESKAEYLKLYTQAQDNYNLERNKKLLEK